MDPNAWSPRSATVVRRVARRVPRKEEGVQSRRAALQGYHTPTENTSWTAPPRRGCVQASLFSVEAMIREVVVRRAIAQARNAIKRNGQYLPVGNPPGCLRHRRQPKHTRRPQETGLSYRCREACQAHWRPALDHAAPTEHPAGVPRGASSVHGDHSGNGKTQIVTASARRRVAADRPGGGLGKRPRPDVADASHRSAESRRRH